MAINGQAALKGELCRALGLSAHAVRRIVLVVDVNEVVTAHVQLYPDESHIEGVVRAIEDARADTPVVVDRTTKAVEVDGWGNVRAED